MSKRSLRKKRHSTTANTNLTFKQRVALGTAHAQLVRGEINYNDLPQWMRDVSKSAKQVEELNTAVQETIDVVADELEVHEHVHGESCTHHV